MKIIEIINEIDTILINNKFMPIIINNQSIYKYKDGYYKISYVEGLDSIVIEYGKTIEDVKMNLLEDCDIFPLSLGAEKLIRKFENTLIENYVTI